MYEYHDCPTCAEEAIPERCSCWCPADWGDRANPISPSACATAAPSVHCLQSQATNHTGSVSVETERIKTANALKWIRAYSPLLAHKE